MNQSLKIHLPPHHRGQRDIDLDIDIGDIGYYRSRWRYFFYSISIFFTFNENLIMSTIIPISKCKQCFHFEPFLFMHFWLRFAKGPTKKVNNWKLKKLWMLENLPSSGFVELIKSISISISISTIVATINIDIVST